MNQEKIIARIAELEQMERDMNELSSQKRLELATKEAEARELKKIITDNNFMETEGFKELQELRITKKWIDIYNGEEPIVESMPETSKVVYFAESEEWPDK